MIVLTIGRRHRPDLGLNLWALRLDLAGAVATEKEEFDGDDIPREARLAAMLSIDF